MLFAMSHAININRKEYLLSKMLSTPNLSVREFSQEHGVSKTTLYTWLKLHHLESTIPSSQPPNPNNWSGERKLSILLETASLNEQELSAYCREHGLYIEQIAQWKASAIQANEHKERPINHHLLAEAKKRNRQLEKELKRKEKALAEAAALLVLQKKAQAIWGEDADE